MCHAHGDCGSLLFLYLRRSLNLFYFMLPVWSIYTLTQLRPFNLYMPHYRFLFSVCIKGQRWAGIAYTYSYLLRAGRSEDQILVVVIFSAPLQITYGAHPTGSSRGQKRPGSGVDQPPHITPRLKQEYSYASTHLLGFRGLFYGELHIFTFYFLYIV